MKASTARHRGVALMLVLLATAVAVILALSFQAAQSTTLPIAQNINQHAAARTVAESALWMATTHVRTSATWRQDFAAGGLPVNAPLGQGTFTLLAEDGQDLNGDGIISVPAEGDGSLTDDASDPVTLTVIARVGNATHRLSAVVQPSSANIVVKMLYLLQSGSPVGFEQDRIQLFESWGYTVVTLPSTASRATIDQTIASHGIQVVYLSSFVPGTVAGKVDHITLGVVNEQAQAYPFLGIASGGADSSASVIQITDNTHYITSPFPLGPLTITTQSIQLRYPTGTVSPSLRTLARRSGASQPTLAVLERGDTTHTGGRVPGRRVMLPWSGNEQHFHPTTEGRLLIRRAVEWAAADAPRIAGLWAEWFSVGSSLSTLSGVNWDATPTHTSIEPLINWPSTGGALYSGGPVDTFGVKLSGRISIPASGVWTFFTDSDDGSDLWINGQRIVNNDGLHAMLERSGSVTLTAGEHDIVVRCFENYGGVGLIARWAGPGVSKQVIPASVLSVGPSNGNNQLETVQPQLVALYSFNPPAPVQPNLIAHWRLNETSATGGGVSVGGTVTLSNNARIDAYRSSQGAYGGANVLASATVSTNGTANGQVTLSGSSQIAGQVLVGPGGNPATAVSTSGGASVTGGASTLPTTLNVSQSQNAPNLPNQANVTFNGGVHVVSSSFRCSQLNVRNGAVVTISGHVVIDVLSHASLENGQILVPPGSSLSLHVGNNFTLTNNSSLNPDSSGVSRVSVHMTGVNKDLSMQASTMAARVYGSNNLALSNNARLFGSYVGPANVSLTGSSSIHVDLDSPTTVGTVIQDSVGGYHGLALNQPALGAPPPAPLSGTAIAFDGVNDLIAVHHRNAFLLDQGTLSFWVRTSNPSRFQGILTKDAINFGTGGHLSAFIDGRRITARLQNASSISAWVLSSPISANTWYHVALSWGIGGFRLYVNGSHAETHSYTGGLGTSSGGAGNHEPWVFGANTWLSNAGQITPLHDYLDGAIDDIRLYDSALSAGQIANLAAGQEPGPAYPPIVHDTSGFGTPLNLTIAHPDRVTWLPAGAGLRVDSPTAITSGGAAAKIHAALDATDQLTLEVVFTPANLSQNGPARLATLSPDPFNCNVTIGQDAAGYLARLRTSATGSNGTPDLAATGLTLQRQHVILTYNGQTFSLYRNGALQTQVDRTGHLGAWNSAFPLVLANEPTADRPWLGTLHRVAVWDRGMNALQVRNLFNGQPPGDGVSNLAFSVRWME